MLAKMIDKIVALKQTQIFDIDGEHYTDGDMTRIRPMWTAPGPSTCPAWTASCKLIRTEA